MKDEKRTIRNANRKLEEQVWQLKAENKELKAELDNCKDQVKKYKDMVLELLVALRENEHGEEIYTELGEDK